MSHAQEAFCQFIGDRAFEDDGGWSWEVWQAAYFAALHAAGDRFKRLGDIPMTGKEISVEIEKLK